MMKRVSVKRFQSISIRIVATILVVAINDRFECRSIDWKQIPINSTTDLQNFSLNFKENVLISNDTFQKIDDDDRIVKENFQNANNLIDFWSTINKKYYHHYLSLLNDSIVLNQLIDGNFCDDNDRIDLDLDRQCLALLKRTLLDPLQNEWSAKLLDSSATILGSGLLSGTFTNYGDFDQCLRIQASIENHQDFEDNRLTRKSDRINFYGQYCLMSFGLRKSASVIDFESDRSLRNLIELKDDRLGPHWRRKFIQNWIEINQRFRMTRGICLPSVCRAKFVENLFRKAIELLKKFELRLEYCQTKNQTQFEEWLTIKISLSLIIVFLLILITSGTLIETLQVERIKNQDDFDEQIWDRKQSILKCFSLISNGKNLFDFVEKRNEFPWIDGLRSLFTMMLVLAHSTLSQGVVELSPISPFQHFPDNFHRYSRIVSNWYLYNSLFLVKFFFVMGGFLVGTNHLRKSKSGLNRMNFFRFFMNRWLRFTPSFIGYVLFTSIMGFIGQGPLFHTKIIENYLLPCWNNLHWHLFYVHNWLDFSEMCGFQSWYIGVDFQLYLIAFPVLYLFTETTKSRTKIVWMMIVIMITISYLSVLFIFVRKIHGIPYFISVLYPQLPVARKGFLYYWTATYNHLDSYFIGIALALLCCRKSPQLNLSKISIDRLLFLSLALMLIGPLLFAPRLKSILGSEENIGNLIESYSLLDVFITTLSNLISVAGISLFFYICSNYWSAIKTQLSFRFLSNRFWLPLSRLSFTIYLLHVPINWFLIHQQRHPQSSTEFELVCRCHH
ncbi:hypothetical protein SSS_08946 [Sarcoptes scabiei]|uniref:Nose resistant-to-fluoxetine protein N-terminal domain-containing protein n=1 Tax=Sarcoptes scabiei TaxID=52283 RepID=A0A834RF96_SARSC|nr:hypothetical protein SSS_08946 [Sarcoptes scabiei]